MARSAAPALVSNVSQIYDGEMMDPVELKIDLEEAAH
jgi:hypothetical protein